MFFNILTDLFNFELHFQYQLNLVSGKSQLR